MGLIFQLQSPISIRQLFGNYSWATYESKSISESRIRCWTDEAQWDPIYYFLNILIQKQVLKRKSANCRQKFNHRLSIRSEVFYGNLRKIQTLNVIFGSFQGFFRNIISKKNFYFFYTNSMSAIKIMFST